jgi:hypothetical protein
MIAKLAGLICLVTMCTSVWFEANTFFRSGGDTTVIADPDSEPD